MLKEQRLQRPDMTKNIVFAKMVGKIVTFNNQEQQTLESDFQRYYIIIFAYLVFNNNKNTKNTKKQESMSYLKREKLS